MSDTELCKIGISYLVDKCPSINHSYTPQYHELLKNIRSSTKLLLEIGIGNIPLMKGITGVAYKPGASMRMWRDYFPAATIVGCDILPSVLFEEDRVKTFQVDQNSVESLNQLIRSVQPIQPFADIILDDGSHQEKHMVTSFKELWKFVRPGGGIYIIEDINYTFFDRIINLPTEANFTDAECIMVYNGMAHRTDDKFVAFRKK
jgi:8-demethyl-8-alpha-L-rhamnosyltetracenomycin-C 2'-O-methyltransferase